VVAPGAGICSIPATASNGWPTAYKNNPHVLENGVDTLDPEHFISNNKRKHRSRNMKPVGSKVRAVEVVSGGASYRPSPAAHSILMSQAAAMLVQEEEKVKAQRLRLGLKEGQRIKRTSLARDGDLPGQDDLSDGDEQEESEEDHEDEDGHARTVVEEEHEHHRQPLRLALPSQTQGMGIEEQEQEQEQEEGRGGGGRKAGGKEAGKLTIAQRNKASPIHPSPISHLPSPTLPHTNAWRRRLHQHLSAHCIHSILAAAYKRVYSFIWALQ
jgi:hypothetical protein